MNLNIIFEGGESLYNPGKACDYMIEKELGLYVERLAVDDEMGNYNELLNDIIEQAVIHLIDFDKIIINGNEI